MINFFKLNVFFATANIHHKLITGLSMLIMLCTPIYSSTGSIDLIVKHEHGVAYSGLSLYHKTNGWFALQLDLLQPGIAYNFYTLHDVRIDFIQNSLDSMWGIQTSGIKNIHTNGYESFYWKIAGIDIHLVPLLVRSAARDYFSLYSGIGFSLNQTGGNYVDLKDSTGKIWELEKKGYDPDKFTILKTNAYIGAHLNLSANMRISSELGFYRQFTSTAEFEKYPGIKLVNPAGLSLQPFFSTSLTWKFLRYSQDRVSISSPGLIKTPRNDMNIAFRYLKRIDRRTRGWGQYLFSNDNLRATVENIFEYNSDIPLAETGKLYLQSKTGQVPAETMKDLVFSVSKLSVREKKILFNKLGPPIKYNEIKPLIIYLRSPYLAAYHTFYSDEFPRLFRNSYYSSQRYFDLLLTITEDLRYMAAIENNTTDHWDEYLRLFPLGKHTRVAQQNRDGLNRLIESAKNGNDVSKEIDYLRSALKNAGHQNDRKILLIIANVLLKYDHARRDLWQHSLEALNALRSAQTETLMLLDLTDDHMYNSALRNPVPKQWDDYCRIIPQGKHIEIAQKYRVAWRNLINFEQSGYTIEQAQSELIHLFQSTSDAALEIISRTIADVFYNLCKCDETVNMYDNLVQTVQNIYHLGEQFNNEKNCCYSQKTAEKWFLQAAAQQHTPSMIALGELYNTPTGELFDPYKAREFYNKAIAMLVKMGEDIDHLLEIVDRIDNSLINYNDSLKMWYARAAEIVESGIDNQKIIPYQYIPKGSIFNFWLGIKTGGFIQSNTTDQYIPKGSIYTFWPEIRVDGFPKPGTYSSLLEYGKFDSPHNTPPNNVSGYTLFALNQKGELGTITEIGKMWRGQFLIVYPSPLKMHTSPLPPSRDGSVYVFRGSKGYIYDKGYKYDTGGFIGLYHNPLVIMYKAGTGLVYIKGQGALLDDDGRVVWRSQE
jgi:hypothetical protein